MATLLLSNLSSNQQLLINQAQSHSREIAIIVLLFISLNGSYHDITIIRLSSTVSHTIMQSHTILQCSTDVDVKRGSLRCVLRHVHVIDKLLSNSKFTENVVVVVVDLEQQYNIIAGTAKCTGSLVIVYGTMGH